MMPTVFESTKFLTLAKDQRPLYFSSSLHISIKQNKMCLYVMSQFCILVFYVTVIAIHNWLFICKFYLTLRQTLRSESLDPGVQKIPKVLRTDGQNTISPPRLN